MKSLLRAGLFSIGILAFGGTSGAATLTLFPNSPGVSGVLGNTTTASPGPNGSFQADAASGGGKSEIYVTPSELFGVPTTLTVGQIASMSFFTNKPGGAGDPDWTLEVYTNPTGTNDGKTWYHARLNAEPYFTNTPSVASNTWHQWSTADGSNPLRFYDYDHNGNIAGTYTDPTWSQVLAGPTPSTPDTYSGQTVEYLSFQTGSAWASGFTGLLDGFSMTLTDGTTATVNFEAAPVPVPSSVWGGLFLLAGLAAFKFRGRASIA